MEPSPHPMLGLSQAADENQMRATNNRLALHHPSDTNPADNMEAMMRNIFWAKDSLLSIDPNQANHTFWNSSRNRISGYITRERESAERDPAKRSKLSLAHLDTLIQNLMCTSSPASPDDERPAEIQRYACDVVAAAIESLSRRMNENSALNTLFNSSSSVPRTYVELLEATVAHSHLPFVDCMRQDPALRAWDLPLLSAVDLSSEIPAGVLQILASAIQNQPLSLPERLRHNLAPPRLAEVLTRNCLPNLPSGASSWHSPADVKNAVLLLQTAINGREKSVWRKNEAPVGTVVPLIDLDVVSLPPLLQSAVKELVVTVQHATAPQPHSGSCSLCNKPWGWFESKLNCGACGCSACEECLPHMRRVPRLGRLTAVRVCENCLHVLDSELANAFVQTPPVDAFSLDVFGTLWQHQIDWRQSGSMHQGNLPARLVCMVHGGSAPAEWTALLISTAQVEVDLCLVLDCMARHEVGTQWPWGTRRAVPRQLAITASAAALRVNQIWLRPSAEQWAGEALYYATLDSPAKLPLWPVAEVCFRQAGDAGMPKDRLCVFLLDALDQDAARAVTLLDRTIHMCRLLRVLADYTDAENFTRMAVRYAHRFFTADQALQSPNELHLWSATINELLRENLDRWLSCARAQPQQDPEGWLSLWCLQQWLYESGDALFMRRDVADVWVAQARIFLMANQADALSQLAQLLPAQVMPHATWLHLGSRLRSCSTRLDALIALYFAGMGQTPWRVAGRRLLRCDSRLAFDCLALEANVRSKRDQALYWATLQPPLELPDATRHRSLMQFAFVAFQIERSLGVSSLAYLIRRLLLPTEALRVLVALIGEEINRALHSPELMYAHAAIAALIFDRADDLNLPLHFAAQAIIAAASCGSLPPDLAVLYQHIFSRVNEITHSVSLRRSEQLNALWMLRDKDDRCLAASIACLQDAFHRSDEAVLQRFLHSHPTDLVQLSSEDRAVVLFASALVSLLANDRERTMYLLSAALYTSIRTSALHEAVAYLLSSSTLQHFANQRLLEQLTAAYAALLSWQPSALTEIGEQWCNLVKPASSFVNLACGLSSHPSSGDAIYEAAVFARFGRRPEQAAMYFLDLSLAAPSRLSWLGCQLQAARLFAVMAFASQNAEQTRRSIKAAFQCCEVALQLGGTTLSPPLQLLVSRCVAGLAFRLAALVGPTAALIRLLLPTLRIMTQLLPLFPLAMFDNASLLPSELALMYLTGGRTMSRVLDLQVPTSSDQDNMCIAPSVMLPPHIVSYFTFAAKLFGWWEHSTPIPSRPLLDEEEENDSELPQLDFAGGFSAEFEFVASRAQPIHVSLPVDHPLDIAPYLSGSEEMFRAALLDRPDRSAVGHALADVAQSFLAQARYHDAVFWYSRALILTNSTEWFFCRGRALVHVQAFPEALRDFEVALTKDPSHSKCLLWKAAVLKKLNRFAEAASCWLQLSALVPRHEYAYRLLAQYLVVSEPAWNEIDVTTARVHCLGELLLKYRTTFAQVEDVLHIPGVNRTPDGWLQTPTAARVEKPTSALRMFADEMLGHIVSLCDGDYAISSIDGVRFSEDGTISILYTPSHREYRPGLLSWTDLYEVLAHGVGAEETYFNLDEAESDLSCSPLQKTRYHPPCIRGTAFLANMFHTSYLLEFLSSGSEVCAHAPFPQRPVAMLLGHLPQKLQAVLRPPAGRESGGFKPLNNHRFWIEAGAMDVQQETDNDTTTFRFGQLQMHVHVRRLIRTEKGDLTDAPPGVDNGYAEEEFARDFTQHYNEIGAWFPEFLRLREQAKLMEVYRTIGRYIENLGYRLDDEAFVKRLSQQLKECQLNDKYQHQGGSTGALMCEHNCTVVPAACSGGGQVYGGVRLSVRTQREKVPVRSATVSYLLTSAAPTLAPRHAPVQHAVVANLRPPPTATSDPLLLHHWHRRMSQLARFFGSSVLPTPIPNKAERSRLQAEYRQDVIERGTRLAGHQAYETARHETYREEAARKLQADAVQRFVQRVKSCRVGDPLRDGANVPANLKMLSVSVDRPLSRQAHLALRMLQSQEFCGAEDEWIA